MRGNIVLQFQLDEAVLKEDVNDSISNENPAALEETYFIMPVRFGVGGVELLGEAKSKDIKVFLPHPEHGLRETTMSTRPCNWFPLPLIGFAFHGVLA
jgi:hypothetical protein